MKQVKSSLALAISSLLVPAAVNAETLGMHAGGFYLQPSYTNTAEYIDNMYYRDASVGGNVGSFINHFKPGFAAVSNWNRHKLGLNINADIAEYGTQSDANNYHDIMANLDGQLDITRDSYLKGFLNYGYLHEGRGSPDQALGLGRTFYDKKQFNGVFHQKFNRVSLEAGFDGQRFDYENVATSVGNTLQMMSRNRWQYEPSLRLGYELFSGYEAFVKVMYNQVDYDGLVYSNGVYDPVNPTANGFNRSSTGYRGLSGIAVDLTDLLKGSIGVGYMHRQYQDARLPSIGGITGDASLDWQVTSLTKVGLNASYDIGETTQKNVSGLKAASLMLNLDHDLLRKLKISLGAGITNNEYVTLSSAVQARQEQVYRGKVGAKYTFNDYVSSGLNYTYNSRISNINGTNYDVQQVMLDINARF